MIFISYITFLINPLFSSVFVLLGFLTDRKNNIHYSALFAGIIACAAYWVTPRGEIDLTRYIQEVVLFGNMSWGDFSETVLSQDILFITNLLFFVIGKTGNPHLLPTVVIFTTYFIMMYILTDYANRSNAKSSEVLISLIFLVSVMPFISLVSNIRNVLAFSIIVLALYREYIQKKRNLITILLYISPIFIHVSALALILLRIVISGSAKKEWRNSIIVIVTIFLFFLALNNMYIFSSIPLIGDYLYSFIIKANNYLYTTSTDYANLLQVNLFYKLQKLYFTLTVLFLLLIIYLVPLKNKILNYKFENYFKYLCYIVIACYPIVLTVYFRFTMGVIMLAFICIIVRLRYIQQKELKFLIYSGLMIIIITGMVHQLYYLNRLTYIDELFYNFGLRSIFNMFLR